jgi:hypothetical protein
MLLAEPNIFMGYSVCLVFNLQWGPDPGKIEVSSSLLHTMTRER